jgi:type IV pilus assembly protein PilW
MGLLELVIALALAALLVLGLVQIAAAASSSTRLQRNQAQLQENARLVFNTLSRVIHRAGFNPQPWNPQFPALGITEASLDSVTATGDRLAVRDWSDLNCFDNRNPVEDPSGNPLYYIRESVFDVNTDRSLTRQCRYGPSLIDMTTQIRRQGFINNIESFQVLYGLDADQDGSIESWVAAGEWGDLRHILGLHVGVLLASPDGVAEKMPQSYSVLDATVDRPADGKLRRVSEFISVAGGHVL